MILIYPPISKPCEPPAGIARLFGSLSRHHIPCRVLDANLEGLLHLLSRPCPSPETWERRASRNRCSHMALLREWQGYRHLDRYKRAVLDLNHLLVLQGAPSGIRAGLADYQDTELSPVKIPDLIRSAESPERNPFLNYFSGRITELLEEERASVIGFSLNYLSQALCTFAMIGFLKKAHPGIRVILGGGLVTSWANRLSHQNPFGGLVDDLVAGPGEAFLLSLNGVDPGSLEGHDTPDYGSFPREAYFAPGPILPYSTSTGCYWNRCSFCPEKAEGNPYLPSPPGTVMTDLQSLIKRWNPSLIHLLDNAVPPSILKRFAEDPLGVPWYGFVRITSHLADPDFCRALKQSGCVMLKLGLESGDQRVLDSLHKGVDLETASRVMAHLKQAGISTYVYLLFGTPEEGPEEARKTLEWVLKHHRSIDFLNLALFNLPLMNGRTDGIRTRAFYEGALSLYADFEHPKGWHRKEVRRFLDREFKRHPVVMSILRRTPPLFTSNHAPFLTMHRHENR